MPIIFISVAHVGYNALSWIGVILALDLYDATVSGFLALSASTFKDGVLTKSIQIRCF